MASKQQVPGSNSGVPASTTNTQSEIAARSALVSLSSSAIQPTITHPHPMLPAPTATVPQQPQIQQTGEPLQATPVVPTRPGLPVVLPAAPTAPPRVGPPSSAPVPTAAPAPASITPSPRTAAPIPPTGAPQSTGVVTTSFGGVGGEQGVSILYGRSPDAEAKHRAQFTAWLSHKVLSAARDTLMTPERFHELLFLLGIPGITPVDKKSRPSYIQWARTRFEARGVSPPPGSPPGTAPTWVLYAKPKSTARKPARKVSPSMGAPPTPGMPLPVVASTVPPAPPRGDVPMAEAAGNGTNNRDAKIAAAVAAAAAASAATAQHPPPPPPSSASPPGDAGGGGGGSGGGSGGGGSSSRRPSAAANNATDVYKRVVLTTELFDVIKAIHEGLGGAGIKKTYNALVTEFDCVTREAVTAFCSMCPHCNLVSSSRRATTASRSAGEPGYAATLEGCLEKCISKATQRYRAPAGRKPLVCSYPQCMKTFTTQTGLKNHERHHRTTTRGAQPHQQQQQQQQHMLYQRQQPQPSGAVVAAAHAAAAVAAAGGLSQSLPAAPTVPQPQRMPMLPHTATAASGTATSQPPPPPPPPQQQQQQQQRVPILPLQPAPTQLLYQLQDAQRTIEALKAQLRSATSAPPPGTAAPAPVVITATSATTPVTAAPAATVSAPPAGTPSSQPL